MAGENLQFYLGNGAITLFLITLAGVFQKLRENRTTLRVGLEAREQQRNQRDSDWIANYRTAAEAHLAYDIDMRSAALESRYAINRLERELDRIPTVWSPLPEAPPLFPPTKEPHQWVPQPPT